MNSLYFISSPYTRTSTISRTTLSLLVLTIVGCCCFTTNGFLTPNFHSTQPSFTKTLLFSTTTTSSSTPSTQEQPQGNGGSTKTLTQNEIMNLQTQAEQLAYDSHDNYAMNALFVNIDEKPMPQPCTIIDDTLPSDLPPGCLLRIGPNGATIEEGFLDGDGLIHSITIPPSTQQQPMYSCTYVETNGRTLEKEVNANINNNNNNNKDNKNIKFRGSLGAAPYGWPMLQNLIQNGIDFQTLSCQKDTCNTAMAISGQRILALMEQCPPSEIQVYKDGSIKTIASMLDLDGAIKNAPITGGNFGAHGRTDPETGERVHVSYNTNEKPFVKVDTFDENWKLMKSQGVDVPAPIMVHDSTMSSKYVVICDFPLTVRPRRLMQNQFPVEYEPSHGARIGLVPRTPTRKDGDVDDTILWFDVEPGVTLHLANAYDTDDGNVVVHGFMSKPKTDNSYILDYSSSYLHEWVMDVERNEVVKDRCLNANEIVEFPSIEDSKVTKKCDYTYGMKSTSIGSPMKQFSTPRTGILLDGIVKFALDDDEEKGTMAGDVISRFRLQKGWHFVSEPIVVEKNGTIKGHYVLLVATEVPEEGRCSDHEKFVLENKSMRSQMLILDGDDISRGPVSVIDLPSNTHVNYGLHSLYVPWDLMIDN